jgi:hypothetical protein
MYCRLSNFLTRERDTAVPYMSVIPAAFCYIYQANLHKFQLLTMQARMCLTKVSPTGYPPYAQYPQPAVAQQAPSLPPDLSKELSEVLEKLTGTKESIKGTKAWFMERVAVHLSGMVTALRDRVLGLSEVDKQLHVIYLVNDILFSW